jgi:hypothetical protein
LLDVNRRIVVSSDLLGFTSSKTERFILFSVQGTRKILLHIHTSKASATHHIGYRVGKHLSDMFLIINDFTQRDVLLPLLSNCTSESAIRKFQANKDGSKLNDMHHFLVYVDDVNIMGGVYIL